MASTSTNLRSEPVSPAAVQRPSRELGTIPELDGIRGIAVLLVMLCHSELILPNDGFGQYLTRLFRLGWSGVDLFFVLSGFLITGILLDTRGAANYFSSFYARRVLRIFPLYLLAVFVTFRLILPFVPHFGGNNAPAASLEPWFWLHLSNWKIAFDEQRAGWLLHFWSLSIEEQFYLVWPLTVFLAGRKWIVQTCLACIGLSLGLRCFYAGGEHGFSFFYTLTPFRIEPLAFGALAAALVRRDDARKFLTGRSWFGLLGLAAAIGIAGVATCVILLGSVGHSKPPMVTLGFTSFAILYTSFVLFGYLNAGSSARASRLLRSGPLKSLGKYSYAIYVIHLPLFVGLSATAQKAASAMGGQSYVTFVLAVATGIGLSFVAALLSWHLIEKRFLALKSRFAVHYS